MSEDDLEHVSPRHRKLINDLRHQIDQAAEAGTPPCGTTVHTTIDLIAGALAHRVLSDDTIVHAPHENSTDPCVSVLLDLSAQIDSTASSIAPFAASSECACDHVDSAALASLSREASGLAQSRLDRR